MGKISTQRRMQSNVQKESERVEKTLVIGDLEYWNAQGRNTKALEHVQFSDLGTLTQASLDALAPSVVLSPLVSADFDVLDVAERLATLKYEGRYRVISENVPNVKMIKEEVRAHAPDLDFDLLMMSPIANDG